MHLRCGNNKVESADCFSRHQYLSEKLVFIAGQEVESGEGHEQIAELSAPVLSTVSNKVLERDTGENNKYFCFPLNLQFLVIGLKSDLG